MARIAGVDLPEGKRIDIGLTAIYGIGREAATKLLEKNEIDPAIRVKDLNSQQITLLQKAVDQLPVEGILRKKISQDIQRLKTIKSYRGLRHQQGLPARGQRTRSNARTKRGKRRTVGALKKRDLAKREGAAETKDES